MCFSKWEVSVIGVQSIECIIANIFCVCSKKNSNCMNEMKYLADNYKVGVEI